MNAPASFRCQGKHFFLTFPRQKFEMDEYWKHLKDKFGDKIQYAVISEETHEDGSPHMHAGLSFSKRMDFRTNNVLDFGSKHGNLQPSRKKDHVEDYVKKHGNYKEYGEKTSEEETDPYTMSNFSSRVEFFRECYKKKVPYQYAADAWREISRVDSSIRERRNLPIPNPILRLLKLTIPNSNPNTPAGANPPTGANLTPDSLTELSEIAINYDNKWSTWIIGPSGCGKTNWALREAPLPTMVVTHIDQLKEFNPALHKSIIFDDMNFTHWPREAQIHLVDGCIARTLHVRYGIVKIPEKTPKIFTSNVPIFTDDPAINRRVNKLNFY